MAPHNRYSTAQPTPGRQSMAPTQSRATLLGELPPYKKPSHPLNEKAQDRLKTINARRTVGLLQDHHKKAESLIIDAVRRINDQVREAEKRTARRRKSKWDKGLNLDEQEDEERALEELKEKTAELTRKLEIDMRAVIDGGTAVQRIEDTLEWLRVNAPRQLSDEYATQTSQRQSQSQSQRRRRRQRDEDGDEEMEDEEEEESSPGPTPLDGSRVALTGPYEMFKDRQNKKHDEYTSISHSTRYAKHNSYIGFKKMVHDAQYGDSGPAMPRPDTWFTESGSPAPGITATQDGDEDDDIVVDKATISTKCPLTLQRFKDPLTSSKCPHTFEKTAVLDMIRGSEMRLGGNVRGQGVKAIQCPVSGCDQQLTAADLQPDEILIRKIKRMQALESREDEDSDDEDVTVPHLDQSQMIGSSDAEEEASTSLPARHKREEMSSVPMPQASQVVDLGDPSDEDDE